LKSIVLGWRLLDHLAIQILAWTRQFHKVLSGIYLPRLPLGSRSLAHVALFSRLCALSWETVSERPC
jgi:hypothetical protein